LKNYNIAQWFTHRQVYGSSISSKCGSPARIMVHRNVYLLCKGTKVIKVEYILTVLNHVCVVVVDVSVLLFVRVTGCQVVEVSTCTSCLVAEV
jgi:hypothetical protein